MKKPIEPRLCSPEPEKTIEVWNTEEIFQKCEFRIPINEFLSKIKNCAEKVDLYVSIKNEYDGQVFDFESKKLEKNKDYDRQMKVYLKDKDKFDEKMKIYEEQMKEYSDYEIKNKKNRLKKEIYELQEQLKKLE